MKKKVIACCSACILTVGACLFLAMGRGAGAGKDGGTDTERGADIETSVAESTGTEIETSSEALDDGMDAQIVEEADPVLFLEDEKVRETPAFAAFLDNEATAHDKKEGKDWYMYEYFSYYGTIDFVHYMTEDMNQDGKDELLVYVAQGDTGFLLVFEETEDGGLTAWEEWSFITGDRLPDLHYCGDGMLLMDGMLATRVGRYTREGTPELLMEYYPSIEDSNDDYYVTSVYLSFCEDGKKVKEMNYELYIEMWTQEHMVERESEEAREGERLAEEFLAALGEKKRISRDGEEYRDKVKTILLEDLLRPKGAAE